MRIERLSPGPLLSTTSTPATLFSISCCGLRIVPVLKSLDVTCATEPVMGGDTVVVDLDLGQAHRLGPQGEIDDDRVAPHDGDRLRRRRVSDHSRAR